MNILELDSYNLADAVKFNDRLNPRLWGSNEHLQSEVREQLLRIAEDFREFLGVKDLDLQDITISGSNAAYTYTPNSDIDLHLVVNMPDNEVYRELFDAKKFQYNEQHNIKIGGYDVELYVQDAEQPHVSQGIYSLLKNEWIQVPRRVKAVVDDTSTENKFKSVGHQIEQAVKSGNLGRMDRLAQKIKKMRQTGLEAHGEFGPENLAFKMLRSQGKIKELYDARNVAKDRELSLKEKAPTAPFKYGFRTPVVVEADSVSLEEEPNLTDEEILQDFIRFCVAELKIKHMPTVKLRKDPQWSVRNRTFGRYINDQHLLEVAWGGRHIMDVLRTVAHELTHKHQHERDGSKMDNTAGETGSPWENEANARAGILMRDYARMHPNYFAVGQAENLKEEIEKAYGILGYKVVVRGEYFYVYKGDQLIYRSVAPRTYTYDQLVNQVKRAISVTGSTVKNPGDETKPKSGLDDAYKKLIQIITYRVDRNLDVTPETIKKEVEKIVNDYQVPEKDLREKWAQTKISKYSNYQRSKYTKTPELFAAFEHITKYFQNQSHSQYDDIKLYKIRMAGQENQWIENKMQEFMQKHGLSVTESASGYIPTRKQAEDLKEANPNQQLSLYRPDGTTYRGEKMPVLDPNDFHSDTNPRKRVDQVTHQDLANRTAPDLVDPIERTERKIDLDRLKNVIRANMKDLQSTETAVLNMRYWKDLTLEQTAQALGLTPERVRQIEAKALRKLRHLSKSDQLKPFVRENASGYIPTKRQAKDPRFSMALTKDIRPGQLGKEANKLKLKTDSQGQPQVANPNGLFEKLALELTQFKKKNKLEESTEVLDEVKMSPTALQRWAKSPEAQGIRAGFEAELIFRDTASGDDGDYEMEPDYDADERCRSIQQIIDFFNNGEYGGLAPRQEARLQEGLDEQYFEWQDEEMYKSWRDERDELIRDAWLRETPWLERLHAALVDGMDLSDKEADEIARIGEDRKSGKGKQGSEYSEEELEMLSKYNEAAGIADDILDEDVEQTIAKEDGFYDEVLQEFRDGFYVDDDSGFFDDVGLRWMSDVANSYDLDWPYMTGGGGNDGSRSWEEIGDDLHVVVDMPVKVSSNYHSTTRREGMWIVEPDSSLEPDDREDFGLEIVSPPLPLEQALEKLQEVCDWANGPGNAYTNSSTGLHMGVSVPFKGGDVDYLKLILFLGDEYVLRSFGREANTYTKSAMSKFRENIRGGRADPAGAMKLMQSGLLELAYKEIQKGVGEGKYTSAHIQKGYIEFRSAGGDWLAEENAEPEKLQTTMLRYARAMSLAANPAEERREYAKKLYKLVAPEGDSELALFSQYAAGELTAEQLKKRWAEKAIGAEKKMNQRWRLYQNVDGRWEPVPGAEWNGYPEDEVKMRVYIKYGREALDSGEYKLVNMSEDQQWEVYDVNTGATLEIVKAKNKGEAADAVYDKYVEQGIGFNVRPYEDPATMTPRAKLAKRIVKPKEEPETDTVDNYRGKWEFFYVPTGRVLDAVDDASIMQARAVLADTQRRYDDLPADQIQMRKADAEQEPAVAQNFGDNPYAAYERNSDRIDAIRQDATNRVGSWSIYDVTLGREISRMDNVAWSQADRRADELEQSTGHNMSVRGLSESVDAVSGTGAIARAIAGAKPPSPVPVRRKDPAVKLDIKNKPLDPYAQTYKKPVEEGYGQYTRINDPGIFPDGFLYLSNHAKHDRLPERGIDMDRVIDLCRQAGNQYPQKLRNLGDIQFVIKAPDDFGVGLVKYQTPDGHYRYLIKTAHNRLRYGPEEPVFRVDSLTETLPAKNLNQLYNIKKQLANPAFSTAEPAPAEKPVPARPAQPRVHTALADLQRQRDKVQQIMDLKQELETLTARAGRTRYGITPGLAADIEDIYPEPKSEADMDAMLQGYEIQKKKLTDYIARQRKVFPKESVAEGIPQGLKNWKQHLAMMFGGPRSIDLAQSQLLVTNEFQDRLKMFTQPEWRAGIEPYINSMSDQVRKAKTVEQVKAIADKFIQEFDSVADKAYLDALYKLKPEAYHQEMIKRHNAGMPQFKQQDVKEQGVAEGSSNNMSTEDMIAYLRQHHDTNLHQDYLDHINTFGKFVLKNIPVKTLKTELSGLDQSKVERYRQMDFSKAPPIVVGDGYILDGYHRAVAAKALGIATIKAYVGVKGQPAVAENFEDGRGPGRPGDSQRHGIPKGATMAELEKASHASGRKGQLARWQLNMRRGKKK